MVDPESEKVIQALVSRLVDYLWTLNPDELREFEQAMDFLIFMFRNGGM